MSCWRRTTVLRIPASTLGFLYRRQWDEFLKIHENDFDWSPGFFNESLCDHYPYSLGWRSADFYNPDWRLDQRDPEHPGVVPGPFLDYYLEEIIPLLPEHNSYGQNDKVVPLTKSEMEEYLPLYQKILPHLTLKEMEAVCRCEYEWYDGSNSPYMYLGWE